MFRQRKTGQSMDLKGDTIKDAVRSSSCVANENFVFPVHMTSWPLIVRACIDFYYLPFVKLGTLPIADFMAPIETLLTVSIWLFCD